MISLYLHFLNGPLKHQALLFPEGKLICGQDEECDIHLILDGDSLSFELDKVEEEIFLASDISCYVGGQLSEVKQLPREKVIEVAGCQFLISERNKLDLPVVLPTLYTAQIPTGRWGLSLRIAPLMLLVLIVSLAVGSLTHRGMHTGRENPEKNVRQWLEQQQDRLPGVKLAWQNANQVTLTGYYPGQVAINPVLRMLKKHAIRYQLQAFNEEDINDNVQYLAARFGYDTLSVTAGKNPGEVEIGGVIIADDTWRKFLRELKNIDGLQQWEIKNIALMNTKDLINLVKDLGLLGKVSIERDKQSFIITGQLEEEQRDALNKGLARLTGGYQDKIMFQNMDPVSPSDSIFPNPVVSVGGSKDKPFVELLDGRRLQPGARLENNHEIVSINAKNGIDLLVGDNLLHYTFNF